MRIESSRPTCNGGYLHRVDSRRSTRTSPTTIALRPTRHDLTLLARKYETAVKPARLSPLADSLGVSVDSLQRLGVGWAFDTGAWSFPMISAEGKVLGIRCAPTAAASSP
jgi:hypothetical protein